jgi:hypothetical protein
VPYVVHHDLRAGASRTTSVQRRAFTVTIDPLLLAIADVLLILAIGIAIYGSATEFKLALRGWARSVFSVEFFDLGWVPPFRLQLWLYGSAALLWGQYCLLRQG